MKMRCPPATQSKSLNRKNRNEAIKDPNINYGPINESEKEYFSKAAKHWNKSLKEAVKQKCYNCVAYDVSPRMEKCGGAIKGKTGYCWMHSFSCAGKRSCYTWAKGGPITEDSVSYAKQEKNLKENKTMKTFKTFFEETEIENLEALISNPDPSRVKMYGGGTAYVDMLKKKLERAKKSKAIQSHLQKSPLGRAIEDEEVKKLSQDELLDRYNDFGIRYKGYHLEVQRDEEPGERYFYYGTIYNPQGEGIKMPKTLTGGIENFVTTMGDIKKDKFIAYIDSISNEEDAQDRCKRKADQVYGKKTSAYKSGAIVRCRQGKIWKKK